MYTEPQGLRVYGLAFRVNIGIMEKKMETIIVYWGFIGIMEKKIKTTIVNV